MCLRSAWLDYILMLRKRGNANKKKRKTYIKESINNNVMHGFCLEKVCWKQSLEK